MIEEHRKMVRAMYGKRDRRMVTALLDETILWTDDVADALGVGKTEVYKLYSAGRIKADAHPTGVHPTGVPVGDAHGGSRGFREIRGITRGRLLWWGWAAGRFDWDPETGEFARAGQPDGSDTVRRARLRLAADAPLTAEQRTLLTKRVENPEMSLSELAELVGITKDTLAGRLRRVLADVPHE